jgi:hypothetical protein
VLGDPELRGQSASSRACGDELGGPVLPGRDIGWGAGEWLPCSISDHHASARASTRVPGMMIAPASERCRSRTASARARCCCFGPTVALNFRARDTPYSGTDDAPEEVTRRPYRSR